MTYNIEIECFGNSEYFTFKVEAGSREEAVDKALLELEQYNSELYFNVTSIRFI